MAVKKKNYKPLCEVRNDFADAVENVCNASMFLLQAVDSLLSLSGDAITLPSIVRTNLQARSTELRHALIGKDD